MRPGISILKPKSLMPSARCWSHSSRDFWSSSMLRMSSSAMEDKSVSAMCSARLSNHLRFFFFSSASSDVPSMLMVTLPSLCSILVMFPLKSGMATSLPLSSSCKFTVTPPSRLCDVMGASWRKL